MNGSTYLIAFIADPDNILPTYRLDFFRLCKDCGVTYRSSPKRKSQDTQRKIKLAVIEKDCVQNTIITNSFLERIFTR